MSACACVRPIRMATFCGRCYHQIVTVEPTPRPPSVGVAPVHEAGAGRPTTPAPAVDLAAFNADDEARIAAVFERGTGR